MLPNENPAADLDDPFLFESDAIEHLHSDSSPGVLATPEPASDIEAPEDTALEETEDAGDSGDAESHKSTDTQHAEENKNVAEEPPPRIVSEATQNVEVDFDKVLKDVPMPLLGQAAEAAERRRRWMLRGLAALMAICGVLTAGALFLGDDSADGDNEDLAETQETVTQETTEPVFLIDVYEKDEVEAPEPVAETPAEPELAPDLEEQPAQEGATRTEATFGDAAGFRPALIRAGIENTEAAALERAMAGVLDFRRLHRSDRIIVERDEAGALVLCEYHDDPTQYVRVTAQLDDEGESSFVAERVEREVDVAQITRGGTVSNSLGNAMADVGLGRSIVGLFVEVFEGEFNFSSGARQGDVFRVILDEERIDGEFYRHGQVRALEYVGRSSGRLRAFYYEAEGLRGDWYNDEGRALRGGWLRVPTRYERISSPFDPRRMHPILRTIRPHNGVDFAASTGTPVWAAADGVVTWAGDKGPNGNLVSIRHQGGYSSHYAHLHQIQRGIEPGVEVTQRQLIGTVGTTGRSTGPHLHFGLRRGERHIDPMLVINGPGQLLPARHRGAFRRDKARLESAMAEIVLEEPAHEAQQDSTEPVEAMD